MFKLAVGMTLLLCLMGPAALAQDTSSSPHIAILWPDSQQNSINPRLVFQCADTSCSDMAQAKQVDYVTAVPVQSEYGTPTPAPSPITFIDPVASTTTFMVYVSNESTSSSSTWKACTLEIGIGTKACSTSPHPFCILEKGTSCAGAVMSENTTSTVAVIALGTAFIGNAAKATPPEGYRTYNPVPSRSVTFKNNTSSDICLNLKTKFNEEKCTGTGDVLIASTNDYVLEVSGSGAAAKGDSGGGSMSQAAFVTGYKNGGDWVYTGYDASVGVYATAMEWTMYPTAQTGTRTLPPNTTNHSLGMSDVDVSVVNGFNFGVTLSVTPGSVCGLATLENGATGPSLYRLYSGAIAQFPVNTSQFESLCPSMPVFNGSKATQLVVDPNKDFLGCLSPCKYALEVQADAGLTSSQVDAICCSGSYDNSVKCTNTEIPWGNTSGGQFKEILHGDLPYVKNIKGNSTNVYTWQFDDDNGNFSCDPRASFTFEISVR